MAGSVHNSLNAIKVNLEGALTTTNDAIHEMFRTYCGQVEEILCICRSLSRRWEQKIEDINSSTSISLQPGLQPALIRPTRGRPHFDISQEQLLYLTGMSFTWTNIEKNVWGFLYIYLPRINATLKRFLDGWNNHSIRTENNKSPFQLYTEGRSGLDIFDVTDDSFGIIEEGLPGQDDEGVNVIFH